MWIFLFLFIVSSVWGDEIIEMGDILEVSVFGVEEIQEKTVMVRRDGKILLPLAGEVKAESLSTEELAETVAKSLQVYVRHPLVSVIIKSPARNRVYISGEVRHPGVYRFEDGSSVADAIGLAGGLTREALLKDIHLVRICGEELFPGIDNLHEIAIEAGDRVHLPIRGGIALLGELHRAGAFPSGGETTRLSKIVPMAWGFTGHADTERIRLIRDGEETTINLKKEGDIILFPGDIVIVPRERNIIIEAVSMLNRFIPLVNLALTIYLISSR